MTRALTRRQRRKQNREAWREKRRGAGKAKLEARKSRKSKRSRRQTTGWASDFALGRAYGIRAPKHLSGKKARRFVGRAGFKRARQAAGRRLTYHELMTALSGTKLKAWVCAGPTRTGCGGGKKRYGGSRQIGVLRP